MFNIDDFNTMKNDHANGYFSGYEGTLENFNFDILCEFDKVVIALSNDEGIATSYIPEIDFMERSYHEFLTFCDYTLAYYWQDYDN